MSSAHADDNADDRQQEHQQSPPMPSSQPNLCGYQLRPHEQWFCHHVETSDTMAHLALKYDTTIGKICRANRMQWQDLVQSRRYIWLPVEKTHLSREQDQSLEEQPSKLKPEPWSEAEAQAKLMRNHLELSVAVATQTSAPILGLHGSQSASTSELMLPPHFFRQSAPNVDDFADEGDPLLITTKCMWTDWLYRQM